ncbi:MAG: autophagy protein 5 [Chrysothrix sp. TS-e1954]|nr:MAG: autophagy protein 5 [Chrysothrix sp. TS-e1954]
MTSASTTRALQRAVWNGSIPLQITLAPEECRSYGQSMPYLVQYPRLAYLPTLLSRLHAFFVDVLINPEVDSCEGWFEYEGVPLKWQHAVGLLYDLYSGADPVNSDDTSGAIESPLPWNLTLQFTGRPSTQLIPLDAEGKIQHDVFINSVKEADFLRNGSAKAIMGLSMDDSTRLWEAVLNHDLESYSAIDRKLWNPPGGLQLRHIPLKVYLPAPADTASQIEDKGPQRALRVVQGLVQPSVSTKEPQTLGTALHALLPTVFPSRRSYIHAKAALHGAVVPLSANLQELLRGAAYKDGFLHIAVIMQS